MSFLTQGEKVTFLPYSKGWENYFLVLGYKKLIQNREISWIFQIICQNRSGQTNRSLLLG